MNKRLVAKELVKIAKSLVSATKSFTFSDEDKADNFVDEANRAIRSGGGFAQRVSPTDRSDRWVVNVRCEQDEMNEIQKLKAKYK